MASAFASTASGTTLAADPLRVEAEGRRDSEGMIGPSGPGAPRFKPLGGGLPLSPTLGAEHARPT